MKKQERELIEYVMLLVGLMVFFILLVIFRYERFALKLITLLGSLFYIVWGIAHHGFEGRLSKKVLLEYCFMALFALLLFYFVLGI